MTPFAASTSLALRPVRLAWPYVVPFVVIVLEWALLSPVPALVDHFQFWAAGHLAVSGRSPYDGDAWATIAAYGRVPDGVAVNTVPGGLGRVRSFWLYPPQTAFAFAPFGALPVAIGIPLLHLFVLAAAAGGVILAARAIGLTGTRLSFALTLAAISQPFVITVRDGHPIGVVLAGLTLTYIGLREHASLPLAAGVALASFKPQIAIAFGSAVLVRVVARKDRRALVTIAAALLLVTLPAGLVYPYPVAALWSAPEERLALDLSTIGAFARDVGGGMELVLAIVLVSVIAAVAASFASPPDRRPAVAFATLLALSLVVAPYAHDYDLLLALPAAFAALAAAERSRHELLLLGPIAVFVVVVPWVLFLWWPLQGQGDRVYQGGPLGALPVLALLTLAVTTMTAGPRASIDRSRRSP